MAAAPAAGLPVAVPGDGPSAGLPRRPEFPGFYLDHAGAAADPLNRQPAVTPAGRSAIFDGFGFDPVAKAPARGVDLVIDMHVYATVYGQARPDVASFNKVPGLAPVGFTMTLPAGLLAPGAHSVAVRVIAADGRGYFEGPPISFQVK